MKQLSLIPAPEAGKADPLFKWAGGKRWLAPTIGPLVRDHLSKTSGRYIEPFLGGGAVAFWLSSSGMILSDVEAPLVDAYAAVRESWREVALALRALVDAGIDRETYSRVRASVPEHRFARAARLIYLNRLCFNGLYRTNRKGAFNVPFGKYDKPSFPTEAHLRLLGTILRESIVVTQDFEKTIADSRKGDVIFADPPYHSERAGFVSYHQLPFAEPEHRRLASSLKSARERGAIVISTNADTPLIREIYDWISVVSVGERRAINSKGSSRGKVGCVLMGVTFDSLGSAHLPAHKGRLGVVR